MTKNRSYSHVKKQREIKKIQENICIICWYSDENKARGHHLSLIQKKAVMIL